MQGFIATLRTPRIWGVVRSTDFLHARPLVPEIAASPTPSSPNQPLFPPGDGLLQIRAGRAEFRCRRILLPSEFPSLHTMHLPSKRTVLRFKLAALLTPLLLLLIPASIRDGALHLVCHGGGTGAHRPRADRAVGRVHRHLRLAFPRRPLPTLPGRHLHPEKLLQTRRRKLLLGSHRVHMAFSIIFKNLLQCPYCGEFIALKTRSGRTHRRHH